MNFILSLMNFILSLALLVEGPECRCRRDDRSGRFRCIDVTVAVGAVAFEQLCNAVYTVSLELLAAVANNTKGIKTKWSLALVANALGLGAVLLGQWREPWCWKTHIVGDSVARRRAPYVSARDPPHQIGSW